MSSPIGGFMPIPLAMMMPFMAAQSMLMGDAFGKGFQFGKRKISAMSNEEFNSLTMSKMVTDMQTEFKNIVPTIQQSIIDSRQVQNVIISEMIKIVPEFLKFMTQTQIIQPITGGVDELAHLVGTHVGHEPTQGPVAPPPTPAPPPPAPFVVTEETKSKIETADPHYTITYTTSSGQIKQTMTLSKWRGLLAEWRRIASLASTNTKTKVKLNTSISQVRNFLQLATGTLY